MEEGLCNRLFAFVLVWVFASGCSASSPDDPFAPRDEGHQKKLVFLASSSPSSPPSEEASSSSSGTPPGITRTESDSSSEGESDSESERSIDSLVSVCHCPSVQKTGILPNVFFYHGLMFSGKSSSIFTKLNLNPEGTRLCLVVPKNAAGFSGKGEGGEEEMPEVSMLVRNPVGVSSRVKPHAVIFLDTDMTVLMTSLLSGLLSVRSERKLVCIDESQFLLPGQIHQIQQLALFYKERGVAFELYGLKRDYLHRPFPAVRCLAGFARIKRAGHNALCPCGEPADRNVRIFTKGGGLWEIDKGEGEKIVATLEDGYSYIPTCEKHWKIGLDGLSDQIKKTLAKNTSVEKIIDPVVAKNMTVVVPKKKT